MPTLRAEPLPANINCPYCGASMDLDDQERIEKRFTCPACNKPIDLSMAGTSSGSQAKSSPKEPGATKANREPAKAEDVENEMHCRSCGRPIVDKVEICPSCGVRPWSETRYCHNCGAETQSNQEICVRCGVRLKSMQGDWASLSSYYQEEFTKIFRSDEVYTGKWNWAAFFFGLFWALAKGLWLSALIYLLALVVATAIHELFGSLLSLAYMVNLSRRGNFLYYNRITKRQQLII